MKKYENTFVVGMEECNELAKALSKACRFGIGNHHPNNTDITNADMIIEEYYHLQAVIENIFSTWGINPDENRIKEIKENKIKMMDEMYFKFNN